ncbi:Zn-ribbon domain-containing OB-fold protein [Nocardia sp. NPDC004711]
MQQYAKFLPEGVPAWHMPYWQSLARHDVHVQVCEKCGTYRYVPKEICPQCHAADYSWKPIAGTGEIYTYTVVRRGPTKAFQEDAPYVIVHVALDEGFRMIGTLRNVDPDSVRIGDRVRVDYLDATAEWTLLTFVRL